MGKLSWCLPLLVSLLLCCNLAHEKEDRSKNQCKNPKGKIDQVKNLGCKSAVCSQGQGGKPFWKECQQPATEEKQLKMIEIQDKTKEKADQINNKQTRVIESLNKMNEIQNMTKDKVDQINNKQTRVLERQDKMIEIQNATQEKADQINNKQTRVIERQDKMIEIQDKTREKADQINNKQTRVIESLNKMNGIQNMTKDKVDQINNKQTRVLERQNKMIEIQNTTQEKTDQINNKQTRVIERQDKMIENQNVIISLLGRICGLSCNMPIAFIKAEEFAITKNNKLTEINLGIQYIITFQLFLTAGTTGNAITGFGSVIRFTLGGDAGVYGDRTPALWVWKGTNLLLNSAIDGNKAYGFDTPAINLNTWYSIEISQLDYGSEIVFSMKVNGGTIVSKTNSDARAFPKVIIYGGDPWFQAANGKMKDLEIRTIA